MRANGSLSLGVDSCTSSFRISNVGMAHRSCRQPCTVVWNSFDARGKPTARALPYIAETAREQLGVRGSPPKLIVDRCVRACNPCGYGAKRESFAVKCLYLPPFVKGKVLSRFTNSLRCGRMGVIHSDFSFADVL